MDSKSVTAKKEHRCHWCARRIEVGTCYRRERVTAWESREAGGSSMFWTYRAHLECNRAAYKSRYAEDALPNPIEFRMDILLEGCDTAETDDPLIYRFQGLYLGRCETGSTRLLSTTAPHTTSVGS